MCTGTSRQPELARRLEPGVPGEDHHLLVDDDRLPPAELLQRGGHRRDGALVAARVAGVGDQLLDRRVMTSMSLSAFIVDEGWRCGSKKT